MLFCLVHMVEKAQKKASGSVVLDSPQLYEVGYHLVPTIAEDELNTKLGEIRTAIDQAEGTVVSEGSPTRLSLAYTIVKPVGGKRLKYDTSHFGWIRFEAPSSGLPTFEQTLTSLEGMLRFLIITVPKEEVVAPRSRSLLKKTTRDTDKKSSEDATVSREALDKEIEKLVTE